MNQATLVWLRSDLRLNDNPALHQACERGGRVEAVFIATPLQWRQFHWGDNKVGFIAAHLQSLRTDLNQLGIPLHIVCSDDYTTVPVKLLNLCQQLQVSAVLCSEEPGVDEDKRDRLSQTLLIENGISWQRFSERSLVPPEQILNGQKLPYRVFTPYMKQVRRWLIDQPPHPLSTPQFKQTLPHIQLNEWQNAPSYQLQWPVGEQQPWLRLKQFGQDNISDYHQSRDIPSVVGTSRLSPYLAIGAISVVAIYDYVTRSVAADDGRHTWVNELIWREFYRYLMHHFPQLSKNKAMYPHKEPKWSRDSELLEQWKNGQTGFPMVDAGMRELLQTGWMHNRLRMLCASFLVKDLHLDWRLGEAHFMNHLIDGDFPSNNGGWQWAAGCGADAAPYFRHFSPTRQAQRFDPQRIYQQQFIAELTEPGYPNEMVDHKAQCQRFSAKIKELANA